MRKRERKDTLTIYSTSKYIRNTIDEERKKMRERTKKKRGRKREAEEDKAILTNHQSVRHSAQAIRWQESSSFVISEKRTAVGLIAMDDFDNDLWVSFNAQLGKDKSK